ncbi:ECF transporter S component [Luteitalea sp.]|uniref:ECF transporter S component n=1 Tax=Luteitalea sp. TaxID=2004800 RepID=UPI0037C893AE
MAQTYSTNAPAWTLPARHPRALTLQFGLVLAAAWALPAAIHALGLPVRQLLPMHWPAILAGLVYGWRSGAVVGAASPILSYLMTGMPRPAVLPSMTFELAAYGAIAGFMVQVLQRGRFEAVLASVIGGRLVFLAVMVVTGAITTAFPVYLQAAMLPGLPAAIAQVVLLPLLANVWVKWERGNSKLDI